MVGDSFIAKAHGIQYCEQDDDCRCYEHTIKRLTTERDQLREADINNADTIRALRAREGRYRAALIEAKKWVSSYTVQNQIKSALAPVSQEEGK